MTDAREPRHAGRRIRARPARRRRQGWKPSAGSPPMPAFAREVERWRARFAEFDDTTAPQPAGEALWQRIEATVGDAPARAAQPSRWSRLWSDIAVLRTAASAHRSPCCCSRSDWASRSARRGCSRSWSRCWSMATAPAPWCTPSPTAASCCCRSPRSTCRRAARLQVWTLPSRERGPVSVGLMDRARTLELELKDLPPPGPDQLFEITLEPAGGSPTGRPTGPILFKGNTAQTL